jgi:hypothetical protein
MMDADNADQLSDDDAYSINSDIDDSEIPDWAQTRDQAPPAMGGTFEERYAGHSHIPAAQIPWEEVLMTPLLPELSEQEEDPLDFLDFFDRPQEDEMPEGWDQF